jgi:hypothetical protein
MKAGRVSRPCLFLLQILVINPPLVHNIGPLENTDTEDITSVSINVMLSMYHELWSDWDIGSISVISMEKYFQKFYSPVFKKSSGS